MDKPAPNIGLVSLGCPKALVDSEVLINKLQKLGYGISPNYDNADAVVVNTCGFLDSAKAESLNAIGEALSENGKVIVTGCLGSTPEFIRKSHPNVMTITGPQKFNEVLDSITENVPIKSNPFEAKPSSSYVKLTPKHYSYLKISEGCNHKCSFCIIPSLRGPLKSRSMNSILFEAKALVERGTKELLVISQDTSAYGLDLKFEEVLLNGKRLKTNIYNLVDALGSLGVWVRLHYIYPYPHVKKLIPLMDRNYVLPYLDVPFQHAHPDVLKRMARPSNNIHDLEQISEWRSLNPDLSIRSTFIVGFPGETESEFNFLLDWLEEAKIDRVGCFKYEDVYGARSNLMEDHVQTNIIEDRYDRFMRKAQEISALKLKEKVGKTYTCVVDSVELGQVLCRTIFDAPEIDGLVYVPTNQHYSVGDRLEVKIDTTSEYDLTGQPV
ncbi:30S ribosomal protein S12 methylthiotransferase RimO [Paracoccaceae bacterium]|nr:30S ribosomal protein S12 methylthiotransferase RimO [Paracoccaceae bacterium]